MLGSEKQIKWANKIKYDLLVKLENLEEKTLLENDMINYFCICKTQDELFQMQKSWEVIDIRNLSLQELMIKLKIIKNN